MPQIVTCPDCGRKLRVPDNLLGKNVKCPGCGQKFLAEAARAPEDEADEGAFTSPREETAPRPRRREPEEDDYPVSRRRDDDDDDDRGRPVAAKGDVRTGWERVRFGVNLIIIAMWVLVGTTVAAVSGFLILLLFGAASFASILSGFGGGGPVTQPQVNQAAGQAAGTGVALMVGGCLFAGLLILLYLVVAALRLTGMGFFMGVASTRKLHHLRVLGIIAFCAAVGNLLLPWLLTGAEFAVAGSAPYQVETCLGFSRTGLEIALGLTEFVCFFLFLRGVAAVLRKDALATNIVIYMISVPVYGLLAAGSIFVLAFAGAMAMFGSAAYSANSNAPTAVGNMAGTGVAVAVGALTCMGLMILIGLGLFIWYVVLLYQVRGAIDGWLDRN